MLLLSFERIVRGFSQVSSEASRSLKTPLAFPWSAMDVYRTDFRGRKPELAQPARLAEPHFVGQGDRR